MTLTAGTTGDDLLVDAAGNLARRRLAGEGPPSGCRPDPRGRGCDTPTVTIDTVAGVPTLAVPVAAAGQQTFYDAAKLASEMNTRVVVTVDSTACSAGRPEIIGIDILH